MKKEQRHIDEIILLKVIEQRADENELGLFKSWLEASAENAAFFEQLKKTHQLTSNIDRYALQQNWEAVVRKVKNGKEVPDYIELPDTPIFSMGRKMHKLIRVAAILVILLGIPYLLKTLVFDPEQLIISGKDLNPNEPYQLADGSLVYLNGNSEITFSNEFGNKNRKVSLNGEAFFEVQRNEDLPFSIATYKTTTQVLGTSFNVYSDPSGQVKVSVVSGVVAFFTDKGKDLVKLEVGEQGTYHPGLTGVEKKNITDQNFMAWKTGTLYFEETSITEAFRLLEEQYARVFIFEDQRVNLPTLTTTIHNQSLEAVLEELNFLLNTNHSTRNDTIFFKPN